MEVPEQPRSSTNAEIEQAVADLKYEDLQGIKIRLQRSHAALSELLQELTTENTGLIEENESLKKAIEFVVAESPGVEDSLDSAQETPMAFVTRMWEKVKPRDAGVTMSEHVGEIRKSLLGEDGHPSDLGQQLMERFTTLRETGESIWSAMQGDAVQIQCRSYQDEQESQSTFPPSDRSRDESSSSEFAPTSKVEEVPAVTPVAPPVPETPAASETKKPTDENDDDNLLIAAKLKLDDGSVQTLRMLVFDRCKNVSQRFVEEHSLKSWFKDPLTEWLKKVEDEALTFPAYVNGDLEEIRCQFSKKS